MTVALIASGLSAAALGVLSVLLYFDASKKWQYKDLYTTAKKASDAWQSKYNMLLKAHGRTQKALELAHRRIAALGGGSGSDMSRLLDARREGRDDSQGLPRPETD